MYRAGTKEGIQIANRYVERCTSIIQALGRLRQEDCKLEGSMNNIIRSSLEKKRKKQKERKMFCIVRHWGNVN
jgi:hypothetical protein